MSSRVGEREMFFKVATCLISLQQIIRLVNILSKIGNLDLLDLL